LFGFGRKPGKSALDALKERLSLPPLKHAEAEVQGFYEGRNPFAHLKAEWPEPYAFYVRGFAYALNRCREDKIMDWQRQENIATMCAIGMARAYNKVAA